MPPDRGSATKSQKTDVKRESKVSTPRKDKKAGDVNNGTPSKGKQDTRISNNSTLLRQKAKVKKEENVTVPSTEKMSKSSRIDAAKLKDVKKDLDKDLKKVRETLVRNRTIKNSTYKPTASHSRVSEKLSSEGSASNGMHNGAGSKKVAATPSSLKRVLPTSSIKSKTDLSKQVDSSSKSRLGRSVTREDSVRPKNKEKSVINDKQPKKLGRERTRTRTLSPREVKMAKSISLDMQSSSKSSRQVNDAVAAGPSTSNVTKTRQSAFGEQIGHEQDDATDNYEDDFEDYESDFEEDVPGSSEKSNSMSELATESGNSSFDESNASGDEEAVEHLNRPIVEEEKKLDSGNYDLAESKRKGKELQQVKETATNNLSENKRKGREIKQIKEALEKENAGVSTHEATRRSNFVRQSTVARDEGFEDEKPEESKISRDVKKSVFINFASAKKKMEEQKVTAKARKRGEEVLSMIKLDTVGFSLLDLPPVPYEVFMKSYGRSNSQQVSVQTNEDNLSEEVQTTEILTKNKWTQHPVAFHPVIDRENLHASLLEYAQNQLGVGGNDEEDPKQWKELVKYNAVRLNSFLLCRGQAILQYLEQQLWKQENSLSLNSTASYFSLGFFNLGVKSVPFLSGRSVTKLCFSDIHPNMLLTVHSEPNNSLEAIDAVLGRCMLCVWNISKPSTPEKILVCSNNVTSVCFHHSVDNLVFGGLCEGTVCVWDLREPTAAHSLGDRNTEGWVIRSPTYSTAEILKNEGHLTEVTAICGVGSTISESSRARHFASVQICSVELFGVAIVWTVIQSTGNGLKSGLAHHDLGLAYWGKVRLVRSIVINVFEGLNLNSKFTSNVECRDMLTDPMDPSHFYVCTSSGYVVHCLSSGCKPHPKVYFSSEDGFSPATCMGNMVDHRYMLVGFEGGTIQLYCRSSRNPLATYAGTGEALGQGSCIMSIQCSVAHPGQIFILDKSSRIHVWNLIESDIVPIKSLSFEKKILSMKLSKASGNKPIHLAIAMTNGDVEIYQMKPEFCYKSSTKFEEELQNFRAYAKEL